MGYTSKSIDSQAISRVNPISGVTYIKAIQRKLKIFVNSLQSYSSSNSIHNAYLDDDCRVNLLRYLSLIHDNFSGNLLVGEAPGYKGCALTGIPFTSEDSISNKMHNIFSQGFLLKGTQSEPTSTIIWNFFKGHKKLPIFWNAFPFHPYGKSVKSNRCPANDEVKYGFDKTAAVAIHLGNLPVINILNQLTCLYTIDDRFLLGYRGECGIKHRQLRS